MAAYATVIGFGGAALLLAAFVLEGVWALAPDALARSLARKAA
jgi:hypothetical protein